MIDITSFFFAAGMASSYLALKLFLVFSIAKLIQLKWALDKFSSLISGWLVIQALQSGVILSLSAIGLLQQPYFLAFSLLLASFIYWRTRSLLFDLCYIEKSWQNLLPFIAIVFVLFAMWLRSLFFYDYTWDAQVYGLPRLVIWLNYSSVFVHMPTQQLNLFVNEWNGEFNALAYGLVAGDYLGFSFGNLEILLVLFVVIAWIAILIGVPVAWGILLSAVFGTSPAIIGLASTVKGDLLACTAFLISLGYLIKIIWGVKSPLLFGMLVLSITLAVGSKMSVVLPSLAIITMATVLIGKSGINFLWRMSYLTKLGLVVGVMIFSSRLWINWAVYGNPLIRIEKAKFSILHMSGNLKLAVDKMFDVVAELQGEGAMMVLAGSMGGVAWFVVIVVFLLLCDTFSRFIRITYYPQLYTVTPDKIIVDKMTSVKAVFIVLLLIIIISCIASMTLSDALPWAFRYFLPGVMALLLGIGTFAIRLDKSLAIDNILAIAGVLAVAMNIAITLRPGEVLPVFDFGKMALQLQQTNTPLKRISLLDNRPYSTSEVDNLGLDARPLKILVLNGLGEPLIQFLGSHAQNKIQTVANDKDLIAASSQTGWDVVAITIKKDLREPVLVQQLMQRGYWAVVDNSALLILLPKSRLELTPYLDLTGIQWSTYGSTTESMLSIQGNVPEIKSANPSDIGFVSQELIFNSPIFIKASFEGEITGSGAHAAHLSLHSKQPVITLPSGKYTSSQSFQTVLPDLGNISKQQLSFGLGGWSEGSGHLRLIKLELFKWRMTEANNILGTLPTQMTP